MWTGTAEDYYRLYDVSAKHLKFVFGDRIKVGGYASCGFYAALGKIYDNRCPYYLEFFHGFMKYIKESGAPLDFYSWHCYDTPETAIQMAYYVREQLDGYGYKNTESHLNEWNPHYDTRGSALHSASVAATMLGMQHAPLDVLVFYDARLPGGVYAGLFDPMDYRPWHAYYSLMAFNELYKLGTELETETDTPGVYAVTATDGKRMTMVVSNVSGSDVALDIKGLDLSGARYHVIDQKRLLSLSPAVKNIENNAVVMIEI
jgi:hypothetical protein